LDVDQKALENIIKILEEVISTKEALLRFLEAVQKEKDAREKAGPIWSVDRAEMGVWKGERWEDEVVKFLDEYVKR
jgi:hypothetical protein